MTVAPHILAGATAGAGLRRMWIAVPLAVASHFALDMAPHMDNHPVFGMPVTEVTPVRIVLGTLIAVLSAGLLCLLARRSPRPARLVAVALVGLAPDIQAVPVLGPWLKLGPGARYAAWHLAIQGDDLPPDAWLLGFGSQVVATVLLFWLCARLLPVRSSTETRHSERESIGAACGEGG